MFCNKQRYWFVLDLYPENPSEIVSQLHSETLFSLQLPAHT